ncbi:hypothetical protein VSU19_22490 [Verrucomicrobiales bacterium BCK34]|nr:hypothetical protein [Verrucomicrobiales bacterium BCK34]
MSDDRNDSDLLYRQVHPSHCTEGSPNSQAFNPTPKDEGKLSVDDARKVSPEESYRHFTDDLGLTSAGTWAVSVEEVNDREGLVIVSDPIEGEEDSTQNNPAHTLIDFNSLDSKGKRKRWAQALAILATARGCLYDAAG